jgi:hypothetical protein
MFRMFFTRGEGVSSCKYFYRDMGENIFKKYRVYLEEKEALK